MTLTDSLLLAGAFAIVGAFLLLFLLIIPGFVSGNAGTRIVVITVLCLSPMAIAPTRNYLYAVLNSVAGDFAGRANLAAWGFSIMLVFVAISALARRNR